jgi:threonine/homoserine/homoserine lactone efflux protein
LEFINGFLLGMTLQLSLGPVFFAVLHKALTGGAREALKMTMGAAIIDAFYIGLSFTGIALLLQLKILQNTLLLAGALVLIFFGSRYIKKAREHAHLNKETPENQVIRQRKIIKNNIDRSSFVYGLKLTAINPLTIIFWSGTFGALMASGILGSTKEAFFYASGCISATLFFLGMISIFAPNIPVKLNRKIEIIFDYFIGAVLIGFGLIMFFRLIKTIF